MSERTSSKPGIADYVVARRKRKECFLDEIDRKRAIRRVLSGGAGSGRSSDRDDQGAGIEMLWQEGLALGIGSCRRQVLEEVAQIVVWLQAIGLGRLDEGVKCGRGVGPTRVAGK